VKETTQEKIVRLYDDLVGIANYYNMNGNAEDIAHDAILYLLGQDEDKEITDSYMFRCVRDRALNWHRDSKTRKKGEWGADYLIRASSNAIPMSVYDIKCSNETNNNDTPNTNLTSWVAPSSIGKLLKKEEFNLLGKAMKELDARETNIIFLRFWWRMTFREIVDELDIPIGTVHLIQTRAITKLRKALKYV